MSSSQLFARVRHQNPYFHNLSLLLMAPERSRTRDEAQVWLAQLDDHGRAEAKAIAEMHHVVVRAFCDLSKNSELDVQLRTWAATTVAGERTRAHTAVAFLNSICEALGSTGHPLLVIKSLEHWPDLGSDLDLLTVSEDDVVVGVMTRTFHAEVLERSWGDRLAHKWNFKIPGLREAVEVHVARLGQTGEHVELARRLARTSVVRDIDGNSFRVPSAEGSIILATLQRMYRHFYLRLCDIVDAATLIETRGLDFTVLKELAEPAAIWPGVATYLKIISDYLDAYRGGGLDLPPQVLSAAEFGGEEIFCRGQFLRIPVFWQGAKLYTKQVSQTAFRGNVSGVLRLSLLPCLGAAAALEYKATGNDKGVW